MHSLWDFTSPSEHKSEKHTLLNLAGFEANIGTVNLTLILSHVTPPQVLLVKVEIFGFRHQFLSPVLMFYHTVT